MFTKGDIDKVMAQMHAHDHYLVTGSGIQTVVNSAVQAGVIPDSIDIWPVTRGSRFLITVEHSLPLGRTLRTVSPMMEASEFGLGRGRDAVLAVLVTVVKCAEEQKLLVQCVRSEGALS